MTYEELRTLINAKFGSVISSYYNNRTKTVLLDMTDKLEAGGEGAGDVTLTGDQTLTNKTISGVSNTLTDIPLAAIDGDFEDFDPSSYAVINDNAASTTETYSSTKIESLAGGLEVETIASLAELDPEDLSRRFVEVTEGDDEGFYFHTGAKLLKFETTDVALPSIAQNLLLYSEDMTQGEAWVSDSAGSVITANQANDIGGQPTLDQVSLAFQYGSVQQDIPVTPSTAYYISFEIKRGTDPEFYIGVYNKTSGSPTAILLYNAYTPSNSSTPTRVGATFTTPSGCTEITLRIIGYSESYGNFFAGRALLNEGTSVGEYSKTEGTTNP